MPRLIGWRERAALPQLGIKRIKVKVDTGARTSALHAVNLQAFREDDTEWVEFDLGSDPDKPRKKAIHCRAKVVEHRVVKDSGGREENRVIIETEIELAGESWPIELSLTDRATMGFRMLLGRTALAARFMIDPNESYLADGSTRSSPRGKGAPDEDNREEE